MDSEGDKERRSWESQAANWVAWARTPGHDDYWNYSPTFFREVVPEHAGRVLEIGCGEGRVTRDLKALGHDLVAIDGAPSTVTQPARSIQVATTP